MRSSLLAATGLALTSTAAAQVVRLPIEKRHDLPNLSRRSDTVSSTIKNDIQFGGYFTTVEIGSPGQKVTLQLDTGSSDLWVPYSGAAACRSREGCPMGSYNPNHSNTFRDVGRGLFQASYVDKSFAKGDYFEDTLKIDGVTIKKMTMGLGVDTNINTGIVGVGYMLDESSTATARTIYPNLPIAMTDDGVINTPAYSLWLDDLEANTGSILFGGVDTDKYTGDLVRIPVLENHRIQNFTSFLVALTSVEASSSSGTDVLSSGTTVKAVLDCGTTLTYLPQDIAELAWKEVGAEYSPQFSGAVLPCSAASRSGSFTYQFQGSKGPKINVDMSQLVLHVATGRQPVFESGQYSGETVCQFGIQNATSGPYLLGDTFLRAAYVVYDLENNEIGIAQSNTNSKSSNVVAFASHGATIPSSTAGPTIISNSSKPSGGGGLSASQGLQDNNGDSAGTALHPFSGAGLATVCITMACVLLGSGSFMAL